MAQTSNKRKVIKPNAGLPSADLGNVTGTATGFLDKAGNVMILPLPAAALLKRKLFEVRAWGRVTGGTTANFTPSLYYGLSATVASDTIVKAATAAAVDSANHSWSMFAQFVWDDTSDSLQGWVTWRIAGVAITAPVVNANITSADPEANTPQGLIISGLFSASNAGNSAIMDGFQLEVYE